MSLLGHLERHAEQFPAQVALDDGDGVRVRYRDLVEQVDARAERLREAGARRVALLAGNGIEWVLTDLAALRAGCSVVPLPGFFSDSQLAHVLDVARADAVVSDDPERVERIAGPCFETPLGAFGLWRREPGGEPALGYDKVTFTSGTTGTPKGVCLLQHDLEQVVRSLADRSRAAFGDVHLCLLPLSILLENVGGVYRMLWCGGTVVVPPLPRVGALGSSGFDASCALSELDRARATSCIAVPEMLDRLASELESLPRELPDLRLVGVGGAPVGRGRIERARRAGLPAFEGYGISECGSVIALAAPDHDRPGSPGRVLPHARIRLSPAGEIEVCGVLARGYLTADGSRGLDLTPDGYLRTGDLGRIDDDGYVWVHGRRDDVIVTSFGRNVCPEWIEAELCAHRDVERAAVFGGDSPELSAVLVCSPERSGGVRRHVEELNRRLPDYARIGHVMLTHRELPDALLTPSGQPRRTAIAEWCADPSAH